MPYDSRLFKGTKGTTIIMLKANNVWLWEHRVLSADFIKELTKFLLLKIELLGLKRKRLDGSSLKIGKLEITVIYL